ncbi:MAG: c-type cytochrome domain-containing protein [Planctomycetota bacterium]
MLAFAVSLLVVAAPQEPAAEAPRVDFTKQIAPLLLERCIDCHGPKEQKGDLRLDAKEHLFAADEPSVVPGKPDDSDLLRRLGLPADDDELMPQKGEALSKEQQQLFRAWIVQGAEWPEAGDTWLREQLAARVVPKITFELPAMDDAQRAKLAQAVQRLQALGALVQPVAADTEALELNLSLLRDKADDALLAGVEHLAPRLVWLHLGRTAVTDASAGTLAKLTQLRRLQAQHTALGDATFLAMKELGQLETVNAVGSKLGDAGIAALAQLPHLTRVYAWQTQVTSAGGLAAKKQAPKLDVDLGDYAEARLAAATKEVDERQQRNQPINTSCPVADKPIDPQHTVEHDGRRIAFCCGKCKAAFVAEPAKFLAKLPPK